MHKRRLDVRGCVHPRYKNGLLNSWSLALIAMVALGLFSTQVRAAKTTEPESLKTIVATQSPPRTAHIYKLKDLGATKPLEFRGVDHSMWLPLSTRLDEIVVSAKLKLNYTFSPSLLADLSQFKVLVNEEALATVQASKGKLGMPQTTEIELDPRFFTDFSKLRLQFIGHYTMDCEFPFHTSLWGNISNESTLEVVTRPLPLRDDLATLPAPFFDRRDARKVVVPMLMTPKPSMETLRDASVLASWFGALAGYRGVQFPTTASTFDQHHSVVLATNEERPEGLNLPKVDAPTIAVASNPRNSSKKMLLLLGKDSAQLQMAVQALVLGQATLTGEKATVTAVQLPARRAAYDAPSMLRTGTKIRVGDLVTSAAELQTKGVFLDPIRLSIRVPPDVFTWEAKGVPVELRYRYTPPRDWGLAHLGIQINDGIVESVALAPQERSGSAKAQRTANFPFSTREGWTSNLNFTVPANRLYRSRQMKISFEIPPTDEGKCRTTYLPDSQAAVDPDSTIDLSGLEHFATMPNLGYFADSGYPFTKYADLAETALILPDVPRSEEIEAALIAMGHFGASTGAAGIRLAVIPASKIHTTGDRDLLIIATGTQSAPLVDWGQDLPARLDSAQRSSSGLQQWVTAGSEWFTRDEPRRVPASGWSQIQAQGPLGALMGFQSPIAKGRSVVVINATEPGSLLAVARALSDPAKSELLHGDLSMLRGDAVDSFRVGAEYRVGHLNWWRWTWFRLHNHPIVLGLLCVIGGLLLALVCFSLMRGLASRRLKQQG
jgi:cellulose synthase operon protein B